MALTCESEISVFRIFEALPAEETQHMRRVGILVDLFTRQLCEHGLLTEQSQECRFYGPAASYHDIGKAWIPKRILTKPGRLTDVERAIITEHPVFAQKLFDQIKAGFISGIPVRLIKPATDSAVYHHEWWNGNGYPYGIKTTDIPLIARITAICDAYDAMTSNRAYRKAHTHDFACCELQKNLGTQFDPQLVPVFLGSDINLSAVTIKVLSFL